MNAKTDYELEREERIRQNKARMQALNLEELAAKVAPPKPKAAPIRPRGISTKRKRLSDAGALPPRRSLRVQGVEADGTEIHSESRGEIIVVLKDAQKMKNGTIVPEATPPEPQARHFKDPIPFSSGEGEEENDAAFIRLLAATSAAPSKNKTSGRTKNAGTAAAAAGLPKPANMKQIKSMSLRDEDVAKVTKNSITHMGFMPRSDTLVLAACDKRGSVGLWHIDHEMPAAASGTAGTAAKRSSPEATAVSLDQDVDEDAFDGVLCFAPHYQYVSGLKWAGGDGSGPAELFTCSYDGSLRRLDTQSSAFVLAWGDEDMEYSAMDISADGRCAYIGDNRGALDIVDLRSAERTVKGGIQLHGKKVNTVHVDPTGAPVLTTSSTDTSLALWDLRKFGRNAKPMATANHRQTCQAAYLAPDGSQRVVSTSFDNTVRVWDGKKDLSPIVSIKHDNQTGRWVMPFRAVWGGAADAVIVGNMQRDVDVLDPITGEMMVQLNGEGMTAIAARNCVHPLLIALASGTASGRLHVYRS